MALAPFSVHAPDHLECFLHRLLRVEWCDPQVKFMLRTVSEVGARASASHSGLACVYVFIVESSTGRRSSSPVVHNPARARGGRDCVPNRLRGRGSSLSVSLWPRVCCCLYVFIVESSAGRRSSSPVAHNPVRRRESARPQLAPTTTGLSNAAPLEHANNSPPRAYDLPVVGGGARARPSAPCPATRIGRTKLLAGSVKTVKSICEARGQRSTPAFRLLKTTAT